MCCFYIKVKILLLENDSISLLNFLSTFGHQGLSSRVVLLSSCKCRKRKENILYIIRMWKSSLESIRERKRKSLPEIQYRTKSKWHNFCGGFYRKTVSLYTDFKRLVADPYKESKLLKKRCGWCEYSGFSHLFQALSIIYPPWWGRILCYGSLEGYATSLWGVYQVNGI